MSRQYTATLCFGFKITDDKLLNKIYEDELEVDNDLSIQFAGNARSVDPIPTFICIKKSVIAVDVDSKFNSIKSEKFFAHKEWVDRLQFWAEENDCSKPQIGWYLFPTIS